MSGLISRPHRRLALAAVALVILGLLTACGAPSRSGVAPAPAKNAHDSAVQAQKPAAGPAVTAGREAAGSPGGGQPLPPLPRSGTNLLDRQVIKNAELTLKVEDVTGAVRQVELAVDAVLGIVADSTLAGISPSDRRAQMTLRVPSRQFSSFLAHLEELGEVDAHRIYTTDVTGEFVDLRARLDSATEHEQRLRAIMSRAASVDELLKLESELARVRAEVESLTGRLNVLQDRVEFSTIQLTLLSGSKKPAAAAPGIWSRARAAFLDMSRLVGTFTGDVFIFAIGALPLVAYADAAALPVWFIWARLRRRLVPRPPAAGQENRRIDAP